jgi:hypothetical protein
VSASAAGFTPSSSASACSVAGHVVLRCRQRQQCGARGCHARGLARVGEEADGVGRAGQHQGVDAGQLRQRGVHRVRDARDARPAAAAGHACVVELGHQPAAGVRGDGGGQLLRLRTGRTTGTQQQQGLGATLAQLARDGRHRITWHVGGRGCGGHRGPAAGAPGGVGRQDERGDAAHRAVARGAHGGGGVGAHFVGGLAAAHPVRHAAGDGQGVALQRRFEAHVLQPMVTHHVDDARARLAGVVQVGQPVAEARPQVQQRGRGLARHAPVAVGRAGDHAFEQAQHAAHAGYAVERGHEVHLRRAGVGEAQLHAAGGEGVDQGFGAVEGGGGGHGNLRL